MSTRFKDVIRRRNGRPTVSKERQENFKEIVEESNDGVQIYEDEGFEEPDTFSFVISGMAQAAAEHIDMQILEYMSKSGNWEEGTQVSGNTWNYDLYK